MRTNRISVCWYTSMMINILYIRTNLDLMIVKGKLIMLCYSCMNMSLQDYVQMSSNISLKTEHKFHLLAFTHNFANKLCRNVINRVIFVCNDVYTVYLEIFLTMYMQKPLVEHNVIACKLIMIKCHLTGC